MRVLAFDPGETTGIAALTENGEVAFTMTVGLSFLKDLLFRKLIEMAKPEVILVEELPYMMRNHKHDLAYHTVTHWYTVAGYTIEKANPGQWKGMVKRVRISGTHQVDAATMAVWYYKNHIANRLVNILK